MLNDVIKILKDSRSSVTVYLLTRIRSKANVNKFKAVIFPNNLEESIKSRYSEIFERSIEGKSFVPYDSTYIEKDTIRTLPITELGNWERMKHAMAEAYQCGALLTASNFSNKYDFIVVECTNNDNNRRNVYLISKYKKYNSWFNNHYHYTILGDVFTEHTDEIFVLNCNINTVIYDDNVFIMHDTLFESVFRYMEKLTNLISSHKEEILQWRFLADANGFYDEVINNKNALRKMSNILANNPSYLLHCTPSEIKNKLSGHEDFNDIVFNEHDQIVTDSSHIRNLVMNILCGVYARDLLSDQLTKTKGR